MKIRKTLVTGTLAVAIALGAGACSFDKAAEPYKDAGRSGNDSTPALTVEMPDGFNNVATKCVGDVRVFTLYHGNSTYGAIAAVVDPECSR